MSYMVMTVMVRIARKMTIAAWGLDVSAVLSTQKRKEVSKQLI